MLRGELQLQRGDFALNSGPFSLEGQGVHAIFGPSGAGKSSFLRALAGLEAGTRGSLFWGEQCWMRPGYALPTHQRGVGFVFQEGALFPHLSVEGNLRFARNRAPSWAQGDSPRLEQVAEQVGLLDKLPRGLEALSGGERQRLAIGRALLSNPRLLCLDEPFSALDWPARLGLLRLVQTIARERSLPIVYVSHNPAEVERIADQVLFLEQGQIKAQCALAEALAQADSPLFVGEGAASVLQGQLRGPDAEGLALFELEGGPGLRLLAPLEAGAPAPARLRVLAKDVGIALHPLSAVSILNQLPAQLEALEPAREGRQLLRLRLSGGQPLLAEITAHSASQLGLQAGQPLVALIKSVALQS